VRPPIPAALLTGLSDTQARAVRRFWRGLEDATRLEIIRLYDERADSSAYLREDERAEWQKLAIRNEGRLVTREEDEPRDIFSHIDWYEYLVANDIYFNVKRDISPRQPRYYSLYRFSPPRRPYPSLPSL
jgi:hypothetical protein